MIERMLSKELPCLFPGCAGLRYSNEVYCSQHWKLMTPDERHELHRALLRTAVAAIEGNQAKFDLYREECYQVLSKIGIDLEATK